MVECDRNTPAYDLRDVARLASSSRTFEMFRKAAIDAHGYGLDDDDVRGWLANAVEHAHKGDLIFQKCMPTQKYPRGTCSDYYLAIVNECGGSRIFLKYVIYNGKLIVTSFKDDEYDN